MSESFVMYRSFHESLKELSREQYGNIMFALNEYALYGYSMETELSGVERAVFMLMKPLVDANERRRESGKKGGRPKGEKPTVSENTETEKPMVSENAQTEKPNHNRTETESKPNVNANANENVNADTGVSDETRGFSGGNPPQLHESTADPPKSRRRFVKPTVEEIASYCEERHNGIDARAFFDFYESKGWLVGSSRMRDWRASVRTWETRLKTEDTGGRNKQAGAMWGNENELPDDYMDLI